MHWSTYAWALSLVALRAATESDLVFLPVIRRSRCRLLPDLYLVRGARAFACGGMLAAAVLPAFALDVIGRLPVYLSADQVRNVYLGEQSHARDILLQPINNASLENEFLALALQTDRLKYDARWLHWRVHSGRLPLECLADDAEVVAFVLTHPGAIGYVHRAPPGVPVLHRY